jgi:beta-N-acetylhexosaminidase
MTITRNLIGFAAAFALGACGPARLPRPSDQFSSGLSLDQVAGQLMMVGFAGPALSPAVRTTLQSLHPGGVCLYAQNITDAQQVGGLNDELRACLDQTIPPFIAVDQEGGVVVRIHDGVTVFPSSMAIGATQSSELAHKTGNIVGRELRLLGFNMNLAPVLDTPYNLAIGSRAFSDDPRRIAALGTAFIIGQQEADVATVAKHFPGEGGSHGDSHYEMPVRWETADQVRSELTPFCDAIENHLDAVMTAHVAVPAVARNRSPATLSRKLLTGVLRDELGFNGLILTDELEGMRSVSAYGVDRAAVAAINAGADMVFVAFSPEAQKRAHDALAEAIRSGRISRSRVETALAHIVSLKTKRKVFDPVAPLGQRLALLQQSSGPEVAKEVARRSITSLRACPDCLPIRLNQRVALISDSQNLADAIRTRAPKLEFVIVDSDLLRDAPLASEKIQEVERRADVVIGAFIRQQRFEIFSKALDPGRRFIAVLMNTPSPDFLKAIPGAEAVLVNYSYQPVSAEAITATLFQDPKTPGILPMKQPAVETGLTTAKAN